MNIIIQSTDMQAVVERLLWIVTACNRHSQQSLEWHPASCHNPQQSFDHCLHVCWHLRYRSCTSWSRTIVRDTTTRFASRTKNAETFTWLSLCEVILKYTTITDLFFWCHSHRALGGIKKPDNNCQTTMLVTINLFIFFRPTQ